ncbi:hypothetical protein FRB99_006592 [Tulasnella sp. 403]|nr:hypothetical protein FRB99_006592 [Tulasnella sp. 403]
MECSYDDFPTFEPEQESNQSRFERLEARISHLEALLGATHTESGSATQSSPSLPGDSDRLHRFTSSLPSSIHPNGLMDPSVPPAGIATPQTMANLTAITSTHDSESPLPRNHSIFGAVGEASYNVFPGQAATTSADIPMEASPVPIIDMPVIHPFWPPYLPPLELLHHLVETFFTCLPHAGRLLHRGQFVASLSLPPDSPDFPLPGMDLL